MEESSIKCGFLKNDYINYAPLIDWTRAYKSSKMVEFGIGIKKNFEKTWPKLLMHLFAKYDIFISRSHQKLTQCGTKQ